MREITFRAWDGKHMDYDVLAGHPTNVCFYDGDDVGFWHEPPVSIMQFVGFLDKNGKPIFEGDIIYHKDFFGCKCGYGGENDDFPQRRIVIYDDDYACFRFSHIQDKFKKHEPSGWLLCADNAMRDYEVIGNIWENPELLK